jgi:hypothetical protein
MGVMEVEMLARFEAKVMPEPNSGCWLWLAQVDPKGYARFKGPGRTQRAHRVAYEHFIGAIPAGRVLDHLCRIRSCVNPAHLEPVTARENTLRGDLPKLLGARTHCANGHAFDDANTSYKRDGSRRCLACHRNYEQRRLQRLRGILG